MNKLEAVRYILAIQEGETGTLSQRVEQLTKLQAELDFYQQSHWLYEGYKIQQNPNGEWVYVTELGDVYPLSENILSRMCQQVLANIKHRYMALEWINDQEIWYKFVDDEQWVSVWLPKDFLFGVVRIGTDIEGNGHLQWEYVQQPSLIKYFTTLAQQDAKYR